MSSDLRDAAPAALSRSGAIDLLRVVGVVAVIAGHVTGGLVTYLTFPWHVPVFFFLTGYLWKEGRTVGQEWRNRKRSLGYPYLVWFVALFAVFTVVAVITGHFWVKTELKMLYGGFFAWRPFTTFWFLSALLFATLLYRVLSRLPLGARWGVALAGVALGTVWGDVLARTPLSVGSALTCLVFIVAGQAARQLRSHLRHQLPIAVALVLGSAVLIALRVARPLNLKAGDFGTPGVSVVVALALSFGFLVLSEHIVDRLPAVASRVATSLAAPAIVVVLVHPIALWALAPLHISHWGMLAVAVVVPWALGLAALRTPASLLLTGAPRASVPRALEAAPARPFARVSAAATE